MSPTDRPRLVVTDLDGTFLGPDHQVSPVGHAAVSRAAEVGVGFLVATGRPFRRLDVLAGLDGASREAIVSNGAAVYDQEAQAIVRSFPFSPRLAVELAAAIREAVPGANFGFETATGFFCEPTCPSRDRGAPGSNVAELPELARQLGPVIKLLGFHGDLEPDAFAESAARVVGSQATVTHSLPANPHAIVEVSAPGVTKASTLALICAELGIDSSEVAAFGDMPNDAGMLSWAGRGYVVANGHHSLLSNGYTAIPSNAEDGVARTMLDLLA